MNTKVMNIQSHSKIQEANNIIPSLKVKKKKITCSSVISQYEVLSPMNIKTL